MQIQIHIELADEQDEVYGCDVIDYCSEDHVAWVKASLGDVDADYVVNGGIYPDEAWGQIKMVEELDLTVKSCTFYGHQVLNSEEVCWAIFDEEQC